MTTTTSGPRKFKRPPASRVGKPRPYAGQATGSADPSPGHDEAKRIGVIRANFPALTALDDAGRAARAQTDREAQHARAKALRDDDRHPGHIPVVRKGDTDRAPTASRAEWLDPDDSNPNRREAKVIRGWRACDPLMELFTRSKLVTRRHMAAANKLRRAYEIGFLGAKVVLGERLPGAPSGGSAADYASWTRLRRMQDVREAFAAVGRQGEAILRATVLAPAGPDMPRSMRAFAETLQINQSVAAGMFVATMDRLVEHYEPETVRAPEEVS